MFNLRSSPGASRFPIHAPSRSGEKWPRIAIGARSSAGFTLIELLSVVLVLVLLVVLLFPAMQSMRERALVAGCLNNLRQFGTLFQIYAADNNGLLPRSNRSANGDVSSWQNSLEGYVQPAFGDLKTWAIARKSIWACPAERNDGKKTSAMCYALNQEFRIDGNNGKEALSLIRVAEIVSPSKYVVLSDSYGSAFISNGTKEKMTEVTRVTRRHKGIPNFLYADWHAAPFKEELLGYGDSSDPFYQSLWKARYRP